MEKYFIIRNSDGDTRVTYIDKKELLLRLNENYYGENPVFLDEMPKNNDTNYWGESVLIIKGEIVSPKEEKIVTKYNID